MQESGDPSILSVVAKSGLERIGQRLSEVKYDKVRRTCSGYILIGTFHCGCPVVDP